MKKTALIAATVLVAGPMATRAVPITYDTAEFASFHNCIAGATPCDDIGPTLGGVFGGNPGDATSSASATMAGYGTVSGSVSLSGTVGAPILRASATSESGTRQNTNSLALESYTYTGAAPTTRTFGGTLTYSQDLTGTFPFAVGDGVFAVIDVFTLPGSTVDVGATPAENFVSLLDLDFPGYADLGSQTYSDSASNATGLATLGVAVILNPGETVWVWALLQTPATDGSTVDASHTFVTAWDNSADLTPGYRPPPTVSVPEPGNTVALMGITLIGVGLAWRRRRLNHLRVARASCPVPPSP